MENWSALPKSTLVLIFQHLPQHQVAGSPDSCSLVCQSWREAALASVTAVELRRCADMASLSLWLRAHGARLSKLHILGGEGVLPALPCPLLEDLHLQQCSIQLGPDSHSVLADLAAATRLTSLGLDTVAATGSSGDWQPNSLAVLTPLTTLQHIVVRELRNPGWTAPVTLPDDLLQQLPHLTHLDFKVGYLSAAALQHVPSLTKLQHLALPLVDTEFVSSLVLVQQLQDLTHLELSLTCGDQDPYEFTIADSSMLPGLNTMAALQHLLLEVSGILELTLQPSWLAGVSSSLQRLCLDGVRLDSGAGTAELLAQVGRLQQLTSLGLSDVTFTGAPAQAYSRLTASSKLQRLFLFASEVGEGDAWEHVFADSQQLLQLTAFGMPVNWDMAQVVERLVRCCPALQELGGCRAGQVAECEALLLQLSCLTKLGLDLITEEAAPVLAQMTQLKHLETEMLILGAHTGTMDAALQQLTALSQLTNLHMQGVNYFSDGLQAALKTRSGHALPVYALFAAAITNNAPPGAPPNVWSQLQEAFEEAAAAEAAAQLE